MPNGGAFTQAMLKVLKDKEEFILVTTPVVSRSSRIQNVRVNFYRTLLMIDRDIQVHSIKINDQHTLFNMKANMSSYLDPRPLAASISLGAGEAHGVRVGGIYGISGSTGASRSS